MRNSTEILLPVRAQYLPITYNDSMSGVQSIPLTASEGMAKLEPSTRKIVYLARKTALVVATLLAIPDGVAIIPNSVNFLGWSVKFIGLWLTAAIVWFLAAFVFLRIAFFLIGPARLDDRGISFWRFAKTIEWSQIEAIVVEPQKTFGKLFRFKKSPRRLSLFGSHRTKSFFFPKPLAGQDIASFYYKDSEFNHFFSQVALRAFSLSVPEPAFDGGVYLFRSQTILPVLRKSYSQSSRQRLAVTGLIAICLVAVLARKACANYSYNDGNKMIRLHRLKEARSDFERSVAAEPTFAAAWHTLAFVERELGDDSAAEDHWRRALYLKPDLVEPKLELAFMLIQKQQYDKAQLQIEHALNVDSLNSCALLYRALLEVKTGKLSLAEEDARIALSGSRAEAIHFLAQCVLADASLKRGDIDSALIRLKRLPGNPKVILHQEDLLYRQSLLDQAMHGLSQPDLAKSKAAIVR